MGWVVHLGCQGQTITEPAIGGPGSPCGLALPLKPLPTIHLSVINHSHPLRESLKKKKRRVNNKISLKLTTVYIHTGTRQEEIHNVKLQHEHNIKVCNTYCWYNIEKKKLFLFVCMMMNAKTICFSCLLMPWRCTSKFWNTSKLSSKLCSFKPCWKCTNHTKYQVISRLPFLIFFFSCSVIFKNWWGASTYSNEVYAQWCMKHQWKFPA